MPPLISPPLRPPSIPGGARAGCSQELDAGGSRGWPRRRERSGCTWMQRRPQGLAACLGILGLLCLTQPGSGRSRSVAKGRLPNSLHVWEALPWLLGQRLPSLPARRVPPKGPRSPVTLSRRDGPVPRVAPGSPSLDLAPRERRGSAGRSPVPTPRRHRPLRPPRRRARSPGKRREERH